MNDSSNSSSSTHQQAALLLELICQQQAPNQEDDDGDNNDDPIAQYWVAFVCAGVAFLLSGPLLRGCSKMLGAPAGGTMEFCVTIGLNCLVLGGIQLNFRLTSLLVLALPGLYFLCFHFIIIFEKAVRPDTRTSCDSFLIGAYDMLYVFIVRIILNVDDQNESNLVATEKLEDFRSDFFRSILLGFAQLMLLVMYMWGLYERGSPDFSNWRVYLFYWFGVFVQGAYTVGKELPRKINASVAFWVTTFADLDCREHNIQYTCCDDEEEKPIVLRDRKFALQIRVVVSTLVNILGLLWILVLLPVQLASSVTPTDFVLNAIAVFFIIEVDDLATPKKYKRVSHITADHQGYETVTERTKVRLPVQVLDSFDGALDPNSVFVPTEDFAFYMTIPLDDSGRPRLSLLRRRHTLDFSPEKGQQKDGGESEQTSSEIVSVQSPSGLRNFSIMQRECTGESQLSRLEMVPTEIDGPKPGSECEKDSDEVDGIMM